MAQYTFSTKVLIFFPNFNLLTTEQQQGVDLWINLNLAVNLMLLVLFMIRQFVKCFVLQNITWWLRRHQSAGDLQISPDLLDLTRYNGWRPGNDPTKKDHSWPQSGRYYKMQRTTYRGSDLRWHLGMQLLCGRIWRAWQWERERQTETGWERLKTAFSGHDALRAFYWTE